jgi:hypothetical protein
MMLSASPILRPHDIITRQDAIRYPSTAFARDAELSLSAVYQLRGGKEVFASTARKLSDALIAEERRLLRHLLDLHGSNG